MARYKTKKQKKKIDKKVKTTKQPEFHEIQSALETKNQATVFSQSQVNLLYKDLRKTAMVTVVVSIVLLSIFLYMR